METHSAWPISASRVVKHEPIEEDKNDSGITSGSDFHSSSPGSDTSQEVQPSYQSPQILNSQNRFYTPTMQQTMALYGGHHYYHNPLTPPNSEPLVSPKSEKEEKDLDVTLTPCTSPNRNKSEHGQDHLRRLEMTLEKNLLLSSKNSEHSMDELSNKSDNDMEDLDESLRIPKLNSHGKIKTFKCKQCDYVANTKIDQWNHSRIHIREDKRLTCPKCPFITEYKHHLEYHLRNHAGSKPFQCKQCDYSCVNKSMLNSHMKSHSNVYRFSCRDCNYATKYCHSLKLHLRRYGHSPSVVLDEEGNPCPDIIIDIYGTRRGPKMKGQTSKEEGFPKSEGLPFGLMTTPPQISFPPYPFFGGFPNAQILQQLIRERQALAASVSSNSTTTEAETEIAAESSTNVLDLSKPGPEQQRNRRKGPAFRIDVSNINDSEDEDDKDEDEASTTMFSNVEAVVQDEQKKEDEVSSADSNNNKGENKSCQYCNITFGDDVLYTIHMGYHGFRNPFTCNMCGLECTDKVAFFLHIARVSHS